MLRKIAWIIFLGLALPALAQTAPTPKPNQVLKGMVNVYNSVTDPQPYPTHPKYVPGTTYQYPPDQTPAQEAPQTFGNPNPDQRDGYFPGANFYPSNYNRPTPVNATKAPVRKRLHD